MSQQAITNQRVKEPLTATTAIQPWSAESEANRLMDDLFSDIDRMLEGSSKLPTELVKPEYITLQSLVIPEIAMPPAVMPPQELVQQEDTELRATDLTEVTPVEPLESPVAPTATPRNRWFIWLLEKFLVIAGVGSFVVLGLLVLANQQKLPWLRSLDMAMSPSAGTVNISEADAQFINYMQRSLGVIDRKANEKQKTTAVANALGSGNIPSVPGADNRSQGANRPQTVLERVYIPVPMPQQAAVAPAATPPAPPKPPSPAAVASSPSSAPSPLPSPRTVTPQAAAPTVIPTLPAVPPAAPASPSVSSSPALPAATHTLVGLLELGDRSAALFEINGITQRINVGEGIGGSGWALVSVANQEAVIRRNGEVRSIYVGQKF
ncbi:MAG TPA: hypothetical protein V6C95_21145 [Coleofasciculaceae cyanobacterium]